MMLTLRLAAVASGFADRQVWVDALAQSRSSGRILFTDPITVTGRLRREEMICRSGAMGRCRSRSRGAQNAKIWAVSVLIGIEPTATQ